MLEAIIVTGTPGTGKTTLTKLLQKEGYIVLDVGKLVVEEKLYDSYDKERQSYVVNDKKLRRYLIKELEQNLTDLPLILDGHVMRLPPRFISHCIVLRCSIRNLRQRLEERDYSEPKIDENVEAEIMEVILTDMLNLYGDKKVTVISTDGSIEDSFEKLLLVLDQIK